MHEDKLSQDQRIRLESIAQANALYMANAHCTRMPRSAEGLISDAKRIEAYILGYKEQSGAHASQA